MCSAAVVAERVFFAKECCFVLLTFGMVRAPGHDTVCVWFFFLSPRKDAVRRKYGAVGLGAEFFFFLSRISLVIVGCFSLSRTGLAPEGCVGSLSRALPHLDLPYLLPCGSFLLSFSFSIYDARARSLSRRNRITQSIYRYYRRDQPEAIPIVLSVHDIHSCSTNARGVSAKITTPDWIVHVLTWLFDLPSYEVRPIVSVSMKTNNQIPGQQCGKG